MTALFDLPFVSTLFFILAGILIGHLLWFQDRSSESEQINGLESRYYRARGSAMQRKRKFVKLQKNIQSHQTDLHQTRAECEELRRQQRDLEATANLAKKELTEMKEQQDATTQSLSAEKRRCESVVSQLQEALQSKTTVEQERKVQGHKLAQLQTSNQELEAEIQRLRAGLDTQTQTDSSRKNEIDRLNQQVASQKNTIAVLEQSKLAREAEIEQLNVTLDAQASAADQTASQTNQTVAQLRKQIAEHRQSLGTSAQSLKKTQADLTARCEDLESARMERDELAVKLDSTTAALATQREEIQTRAQRLAQLQQQVDELMPLRAELSEVALVLGEQKTVNKQRVEQIARQSREIESLRAQFKPMAKLRTELSSTTTKLGEASHRCEQLNAAIQEKHASLRAQQSKLLQLEKELEVIPPLRRELAKAVERHSVQMRRGSQLQDHVSKQAAEIEQLHSQLAVLEQTKQRLESASAQLASVSTERDKLTQSRLETEKTMAAQHNEITSQSAKLKEVGDLLTVKTSEHSKLVEKITGMSKSLEQNRTSMMKLNSDLKTAEKLRPENKALQDRVAELMTHLKRVSAEHDDSLDANSKALDRIRDLENQLHEHAAKIRDLRRERASIADLEEGKQDTKINRAA